MPSYTHGHHESVLRAHRWRTVENSAAYLIPHLRTADGWRAWSVSEDGWFAVLHGEIVCTAPTSAEAKAAERTRLRR